MTDHVVGAGMAGLACALRLAAAGRSVVVHEGAPQPGGRCRSFYDSALDRRIDNGNHLLLSGNAAVKAYLAEVGAAAELTGPARAEFPFFDLKSGERWTVRPNRGPLPWWLLSRARRVPGTRAGDYLRGAWRLARAGATDTVGGLLDDGGAAWRRFWEPLAVGVLNTEPYTAQARLLWPVLTETFGRGEAACRPRWARRDLGETFVFPAVARLETLGADLRLGHRLRGLSFAEGRVAGLDFGDGAEPLDADDRVVLALPAPVVDDIVPGLPVPSVFRAIVNAHFRLRRPPERATLLGLVGGSAQWLFVRGDVASVTVSAADRLAREPAETIAELLWPEVARALDLGESQVPPCRIVKEKRATIAQGPDQTALRPGPRTEWPNLWLAGDWTDTGLPATVEGALRSGHRAAALLLQSTTGP